MQEMICNVIFEFQKSTTQLLHLGFKLNNKPQLFNYTISPSMPLHQERRNF